METRKSFKDYGKRLIAAFVVLTMLAAVVPFFFLQADSLGWEDGPGIRMMDTSGTHTLAVQTDGSLWAWGLNNHGQLGDGTTVTRHSPVRVGNDYDWHYVSAGGNRTMAVRTDGSLWGWGDNWAGNLGDGTEVNRHVPTRIGTDNHWLQIYVGNTGATAALTNDWVIYCWGTIRHLPVGVYRSPSFDDPTRVTLSGDEEALHWASISLGEWSYSPQFRMPQLRTVINNGVLLISNHIWAESYTSGNSNHSFVIGEDTHWKSVHGSGRPAAAVGIDGSLWTWGDPSGSNSTEPVRHGATTEHWGYSWVCAVAGSAHLMARRSDGTLWSRWDAMYGEHNDGTYTSSISPFLRQISHDNNWTEILASGGDSTFMMREDGTVWAWGNNPHGVLGDGTTTTRRVRPVLIWGSEVAGASTSVVVGNGTGEPGDTVRVPVIYNNNPGIAGFNLRITFDNEILTPLEINDTEIRQALGGSVFVSNTDIENGTIDVVWASPYHVYDETLFYLEFVISENISLPPGSTLETLVAVSSADLRCLEYETMVVLVGSGTVTIFNSYVVVEILWGDVNQDGVVDVFDLIRLAQHLAGTPGMELTAEGLLLADVLHDDMVDLLDLIHLSRYLASEDMGNPDVILGPGSR